MQQIEPHVLHTLYTEAHRERRGDLNGDDITSAYRTPNGGEHSDDADMDGDGRVTSVDALMILQAAGGCIEID